VTGAGVLVDAAFVVASAPVLVCSSYLLLLTFLSGRIKPPAYGPPRLRFDFIVPSHNEELGIASTVESLRSVDYPADLFRVVVVADNCSDATAAKAEAAGATVIVRNSTDKKGKGYALELAFERTLAEDRADAVVVVDADTLVSKNILKAFAARFEAGAMAVQAEYGVSNPRASWRTRLMVIALAIFHVLRSLGRERLRVSAGLRGNGMGFSRALLKEVPHDAFSVVEDLEYGVRLGRKGHRVVFVHEAQVLGEMVSGESKSRSQRTRWEAGRMAMAKLHGFPLLKDAIKERSMLLFDLAMDVLVPPLAYVVAMAFLGGLGAGVWVFLGGSPVAALPWSFAWLSLVIYVFRGVLLSGLGLRGFVDLAAAPVYIIWKIALAIKQRGQRKDVWVRTAREGDHST
jgi:1,2-diacylglycerol 3-beta-glucosyltransferase